MDKQKEKFNLQRISWTKISKNPWFIPAIVMIVLLVVVLRFFAVTGDEQRREQVSLGIRDAIDSISAVLPKGSQVVARFPDEQRHALYYLNSGVMYCFDAKFKHLEEVVVSGYNSGDIVKAELTDDEKFIVLTMHSDTSNRLFHLNTDTRNITDMNKEVAFEVQNEKQDEKKEESSKKKQEEKTEAASTADNAEKAEASVPEHLPVEHKNIRLPEDGTTGTTHPEEN